MSKKNRPYKVSQQKEDQFIEFIAEATLDAREFLETATPFEISLELVELGVKLSHAEGIQEFLKNYSPPPGDADPLPSFEALGLHWEEEIEGKRGVTPDLEDCVFLTEVARHFWLKIKSPT